MKIRAAVLEQFGSPLSVQEIDLAEPSAGEALVRLVACGVCHTDLYTASGADPSGYAPTVLGHEGAGVVEKVGEGVTSLAPGDHVVTLFSPQCGECIHCQSPRTNLCLAIRDMQNKGYLPDGTTRLSRDGEPIRHFMGTSTFAEYTVMPEIALAKVNPEAPLEGAALFACGLSTGLGAALNTAKVEPGSTCVVFGAGMVGLGAVAGCRLAGAERIICVDLSEERLALARGQGATDTMVGDEDTVQRILDETGGFGADYTFEATGNVKVMRQAVESARMGWGLATVAGVAGKGETLDVVPRFLITGRRVAGSSFGGVKGRDGVPAFVERWLAGEIDVDPFISHHITLDDVNRGFELMEAQDGIRSVISVLIVERTENPDWLSNAYLVAEGPGGSGVLIDGNGVSGPLLDRVAEDDITITHMLVTHGHGDHVVDVESMASRFGVPLLRWPELTDGQVVTSGGLEITAMHTPGHCTDHVAFLVNGTDCFTADVLFKGTVGGTAGGGPTGYADIKTSIMDRLMSLDPATVVHPGHTLPTTIGEEWESNPFIRVWRGLDPEGDEQCMVRGEPATLVLWAPDYDGTNKAWVRYPDGRDAIVGGSQVTR